MALGPWRVEKGVLMKGASGPATPVAQMHRLPDGWAEEHVWGTLSVCGEHPGR